MIIGSGCSGMGTGTLKIVTRRLHDAVEAIPDVGTLSGDYLDLLQPLEDFFVHGLAIVRNLKNAACPINRLPPEILAEIFSQVTESAALERVHKPKWELDLIQIRYMHALPTVCRYWHDIAVGTRSLWPIVWCAPTRCGGVVQQDPTPVHSPFPLTADYSGPLSIYLKNPDARKAKELLEQYAGRTRELYFILGPAVTANSTSLSGFFRTLCAFPCNALEHVAMKLVSQDTSISPREFSFLSGGAPRLRSLNIHIEAADPFLHLTAAFPALTHLVVSSARDWSPNVFWTLFSRCPRLEHAYLSWSPNASIQNDLEVDNPNLLYPNEHPTHLRALCRLTLTFIFTSKSALVHAPAAIVSGIVLPPSCHVYLASRVQNSFPSAQASAQLMSAVLQHWPTHVAASSTDPSNRACGAPRVRLNFESGAELQFAHPHGTGSLTLRSPDAHAAAIVHEMLRAAATTETAIPPFMCGTRELWIRAQLVQRTSDPEDAQMLLGALPALERLVVAGSPAAILQALALDPAPSSTSEGSGVGGEVLCPRLETLSVFLHSRGDVAAVRTVLEARARAGCPVRCLVVPGPLPGARDPLGEENVRALRERVEELVIVDTAGWERVEVDWSTRRLREACAANAVLGRRLCCDWPTWEYARPK